MSKQNVIFILDDDSLINIIGKVVEGQDIKEPLVVFNVTNYAVHEYLIKQKCWVQKLTDFAEIELNKVPKYFKYCYIPNDKYLLVGGIDSSTKKPSPKTFIFEEGHINPCGNLLYTRLYFGLANHLDNIYAIAGYSSDQKYLSSCEKFNKKNFNRE